MCLQKYLKSFLSFAVLFLCAGYVHASDADYRYPEYVEQTGSAVFNTGISLSTDSTRIEFAVQDSLGNTAALDRKILGYDDKFCFATISGGWRMGMGAAWKTGGPAKNTERVDVSVSGTTWTLIRSDIPDTPYQVTTATLARNVGPIYIFGNSGTASAPSGMRFFYLKHYKTVDNAETLVNYIIPAVRLWDSKIGLYDCITDTFISPNKDNNLSVSESNASFDDQITIDGSPSRTGTVSPGYGLQFGYTPGTQVIASAPAAWTNDNATVIANCAGYTVYTNDAVYLQGTFGENEERTVSFTRPECSGSVRLVWQWQGLCHIRILPQSGGHVTGSTDRWIPMGQSLTLEAVPDEGYAFFGFGGGVPTAAAYSNPCTFTVGGGMDIPVYFSLGSAAPAIVKSDAKLWFDAGDVWTLRCDEDGVVTNWISKAGLATGGPETLATVPAGYSAPVYDTENFDIPTVDFGAVGSMHDMVFPRMTNVRTIFFVMKIAKSGDAFMIGDSTYYQFHRDGSGAYANTYGKFDKLWDRGLEITGWKTTVIPSDSFRVIAIRTTENCSISSFTQDRNISGRNGGKQLSELIVFNEALGDTDCAVVSSYLMRKWGFSQPSFTISGDPDNYAGYPTPAYGIHDEFQIGDTIDFKAVGVFTNDSMTLFKELLGWSFVDDSFNMTEGTAPATSIAYSSNTRYGAFSWNWAKNWTRIKIEQPRDPKLPGMYCEVEYLERGAGGAVSTDIGLTTNTSEIAFTVGATKDTDYASDTKWIGGLNGPTMFGFGRNGNKWRIWSNNSLVWISPNCFASSLGPVQVVIRGKTWAFIDGPSDEYSLETADMPLVGSANSSVKIGIFTPPGYNLPAPVGARIYGLKIFEKGIPVHNLVPCYKRKDENRQPIEPVPGFYDRVTGVFYPGSGTLLCGPEVVYNYGMKILVK